MPVIFLILFSLLFSITVQAQSLFTPGLSSRSRAMGGTSIATARGVDALFYNTSALAKVEGYSFKILNGNVGASQNSQRLVDQSGALTAADLQDLYGETYFAEITAQTGMVFPFFGVGAYSSNHTAEVFNNPVFPTFSVDFLSDYAYTIGGAIPLGSNASLGIGWRHIKRWGGQRDLLATDLIGTNDTDLIESQLTDKGTGNALDISFMTSLPQENIDFVLSWKDLGHTAFSADAGVGPERQDDNLAFGVAKVSKMTIADITYAFEYDHIRQSDHDLTKKLHFGTEVSFPILDLRAGLSQGYFTYGVGIDFWLITIDAAAYTEELGSSVGSVRSDRYQASISLNLDFDQAFKLRGESGKKRRLMQRR